MNIIKDIRDNNTQLFEKIKHLPKKARSSKESSTGIPACEQDAQTRMSVLLTYFRMGKIQKFFIVSHLNKPQEIDFLTAAKIFECSQDEKKQVLPKDYYELLDKNKEAFIKATIEEHLIPTYRGGKDSRKQVLKILKATSKNSGKFTDEQEEYLKKVIQQLVEGAIPKQTAKNTLKALNNLKSDLLNPLKVLAIVQQNIPERLLESHYVEYNRKFTGKREVILSLYLLGR